MDDDENREVRPAPTRDAAWVGNHDQGTGDRDGLKDSDMPETRSQRPDQSDESDRSDESYRSVRAGAAAVEERESRLAARQAQVDVSARALQVHGQAREEWALEAIERVRVRVAKSLERLQRSQDAIQRTQARQRRGQAAIDRQLEGVQPEEGWARREWIDRHRSTGD